VSYRLAYVKDGRVFVSGAKPETPQEAADDAASYLRDGATRVEIELADVPNMHDTFGVPEDYPGALG
jgi:hypothetical protein